MINVNIFKIFTQKTLLYKNKSYIYYMKTTKEIFEVQKVVKFGMLFGFKIFDNSKDEIVLGYEFDCEEEYEANSKCELLNLLNK